MLARKILLGFVCLQIIFFAALRCSAQDAATLWQKGETLATVGRLAEAEESLTEAAKASPADMQIISLLAKVKSQLGEGHEAISLFRQVAAAEPRSAKAHLNLAIALADAADSKEALAELDKCLALEPANARAYLNRARVLADAGNITAARAAFQHAAKLNPQGADYFLFWAEMEQGDGKASAAASLYQRSLKLQPGNAHAYFLLGQCLELDGKPRKAISSWQQAFQLNPRYPEAAYALAQAYRVSDPAVAAEWRATFKRLGEERKKTDRASELGNKAYAAMRQKSWTEAIDVLEQALQICGDCAIQADLHQRLGLAECHRGDLDLGEQELLFALKLKPEDRQTMEALTWVTHEKQRGATKQ